MSQTEPTWQQLTIDATCTDAQTIADYLTGLGAQSVALLETGDEELFQIEPGDSPLWSHTRVQALFDAEDDIDRVITLIQSLATTDLTITLELLQNRDWVRETQSHFPPQHYGTDTEGFWILPGWENPSDFPGKQVIIDPGLAFGTGTHATTSLCCEWIAQHNCIDKTVIDYGCGSGILSLAALIAGAQSVIATDHDDQALLATQQNANNNPTIKQKLTLLTPDKMPAIQVDILIANILAGPLMSLAPLLQRFMHQECILVLSGLLIDEVDTVTAAYTHCKVSNTTEKDGWARVVLKKLP